MCSVSLGLTRRPPHINPLNQIFFLSSFFVLNCEVVGFEPQLLERKWVAPPVPGAPNRQRQVGRALLGPDLRRPPGEAEVLQPHRLLPVRGLGPMGWWAGGGGGGGRRGGWPVLRICSKNLEIPRRVSNLTILGRTCAILRPSSFATKRKEPQGKHLDEFPPCAP